MYVWMYGRMDVREWRRKPGIERMTDEAPVRLSYRIRARMPML